MTFRVDGVIRLVEDLTIPDEEIYQILAEFLKLRRRPLTPLATQLIEKLESEGLTRSEKKEPDRPVSELQQILEEKRFEVRMRVGQSWVYKYC